jgi:hypothetical protein
MIPAVVITQPGRKAVRTAETILTGPFAAKLHAVARSSRLPLKTGETSQVATPRSP